MNRNIVTKKDIARARAAVEAGTATQDQISLSRYTGLDRNIITAGGVKTFEDAAVAKAGIDPIPKLVMEELGRCVGREVSVEYVLHGDKNKIVGVLDYVKDFDGVGIVIVPLSGKRYVSSYPFVGLNLAIRSISVGGEVIYDNTKNVPEGTFMDGSTTKAREIRIVSFGEDEVKRVDEERAETHTGVLREQGLDKGRFAAFLDLFKRR
jgi:hypothetical protein